jgi:transcriptional regulator with XRE-family HTH domain
VAKLTLAQALKRKKLSKRQFAIRLGIDPKNVTRLFKPDCDPRWSALNRYAKVIGCKIRDLYRE